MRAPARADDLDRTCSHFPPVERIDTVAQNRNDDPERQPAPDLPEWAQIRANVGSDDDGFEDFDAPAAAAGNPSVVPVGPARPPLPHAVQPPAQVPVADPYLPPADPAPVASFAAPVIPVAPAVPNPAPAAPAAPAGATGAARRERNGRAGCAVPVGLELCRTTCVHL